MRNFARRAGLVLAATVATVGLTTIVAPASQAMDSGWGCGGACRVVPGTGR